MTEQRAKDVAAVINAAYETTEAELVRYSASGWVVTLGPSVERWRPLLPQMAQTILAALKGSPMYVLKNGTIHWDDPFR